MSIFATMIDPIERYRNQMETMQKKHGPTNYVDQLKDLDILIEYEKDENSKFLLEQQRALLDAKIEHNH